MSVEERASFLEKRRQAKKTSWKNMSPVNKQAQIDQLRNANENWRSNITVDEKVEINKQIGNTRRERWEELSSEEREYRIGKFVESRDLFWSQMSNEEKEAINCKKGCSIHKTLSKLPLKEKNRRKEKLREVSATWHETATPEEKAAWKKKNSESKMGAKNAAWRGGVSRLPYPWDFSDELKKSIKERDGNKCVMCDKSKNLNVHHIDRDKHNNNHNNLIVLCSSCHRKVHCAINNGLVCECCVSFQFAGGTVNAS